MTNTEASTPDTAEERSVEPAPPDTRAQTSRALNGLLAVALLLAAGLLGAAAALLTADPRGPGTSGSDTAATPLEIGFAQDMSAHHRQAVQMASWERDHTRDPVLRQLAYDIESTQTEQLGQMQGWLTLWGAAPASPQHMAWMGAPTDQMPGMATDDELRTLRAASGRDLDVQFLQLMLRHHVGGTGMLREAATRAATPAVRTLAGQMLTAQNLESDQIRDLITARGAQPTA